MKKIDFTDMTVFEKLEDEAIDGVLIMTIFLPRSTSIFQSSQSSGTITDIRVGTLKYVKRSKTNTERSTARRKPTRIVLWRCSGSTMITT